jgi:alpha,alpha-trehalase
VGAPIGRLASALLALAALPAAGAAEYPQPPQALFGDLFVAVQTEAVYPDGKTFADAVPDAAPQTILDAYHAAHPDSPAALKGFVDSHFSFPAPPASVASESAHTALEAHIDTLWSQLTRSTPTAPPWSSLLPLPEPYVVPGGRFREIYYWDSYFTMLGLLESGRRDLVADMVADFAHLIGSYGHIPNGTRSYYLSRSQPPFFYAMVGLLDGKAGEAESRYLPQLKAEYQFWMEGAGDLKPGEAHRRVVALPDGAILNRYWDDRDTPRDESYRDDLELARASGRPPAEVFRDIRAAAESGWDFSSRWFADARTKATIDTTDILPVDLNSLLYGLENAIARGCEHRGERACATEFRQRAAQRRTAIDRYMWDPGAGVYFDYLWTAHASLKRLSAATLYPLFSGCASRPQGAQVAAAVRARLLKAGGIVTTPLATGEQWDAPNGWAPLQWIGVSGFDAYGERPLAQLIACRWLRSVRRVYEKSGKLVEKYDVENESGGGGGEYPLQDGFGWTNGVTRRLLVMYPGVARARQCEAR